MNRFIVEQDWTTKAGLRAVIIRINEPRMSHRCGYVGVPPGHPLFGHHYNAVDAEVHGGLTFSGADPTYPVESNLHWLGYDCAHYMDTPATCDTVFCVRECESLAEQLAVTVAA